MKKIKLIITFVIFGLAFICHFMYDFIPIEFFKVFFPVNESIWEHMKLLITPVLIGSLFEYIYYITLTSLLIKNIQMLILIYKLTSAMLTRIMMVYTKRQL